MVGGVVVEEERLTRWLQLTTCRTPDRSSIVQHKFVSEKGMDNQRLRVACVNQAREYEVIHGKNPSALQALKPFQIVLITG
jgi:hypothetical protein